jgi:hypothetical protein
MREMLTTTLALALMTGSVAFASQAPSTKLDQHATTPVAARVTSSSTPRQTSTTSGSTKKHKKHHKKHAAPHSGSASSKPKP